MAKKGSSSGSKPHRGTHKRGRGRAPVRSHRWDRLDDNGRPDSAIDIVEHVGGENDSGGEGSEEVVLLVHVQEAAFDGVEHGPGDHTKTLVDT